MNNLAAPDTKDRLKHWCLVHEPLSHTGCLGREHPILATDPPVERPASWRHSEQPAAIDR
jgi:hypothetical protein